MKSTAIVIILSLFLGAGTLSRRRSTDVEVPAPRAPLSGWMVTPDPEHTWTVTVLTADTDRPWESAAWLAGNGFASGAIPVRVWRYRNGAHCLTQTLLVPAQPNASVEASIEQAKFIAGDLVMLETLPAYSARFRVTSAAAAAPILDVEVSTPTAALPKVPTYVTTRCE